ncbi:hypothetical protein AA0X95_16595 [Bacillus sp. 1P10SD]|uniref:hypothetical protein n=1 Tax=Bacillus sp. 1P10SD TaxID=3132265 RepID=UPI0039A60E15
MSQRISDYLVNEGLYGVGLSISKADLQELQLFLEGQYKIEAYCCDCNANRIFSTKPIKKQVGSPTNPPIIQRSFSPGSVTTEGQNSYPSYEEINEIMDAIDQSEYNKLISKYPKVEKTFTCAMNETHTLIFSCLIKDNHIIKFGQFPSLADLNVNKSKKYRKILGKKYTDFNKGIGLHSHGVGAGSLVYLRRIFEELIEEAHIKAKLEANWNEENFPNRMDEKIVKLKDYLPDYLVENRKIYGILSKGIHELPEETCMEIFPIVKVGIEFILDEKIEREESDRKKKETAALLERLSSKIVKESIKA